MPVLYARADIGTLPGHGETLGEGLNAGREIRNLVLAHIAIGS